MEETSALELLGWVSLLWSAPKTHKYWEEIVLPKKIKLVSTSLIFLEDRSGKPFGFGAKDIGITWR